ncbi:MAG: class I SAM-dependent methyltransferase [Candidatus Hodarchaeota archaeon]
MSRVFKIRVLNQILSSIKKRGLISTFFAISYELLFTLRYGVQTKHIVPAKQLDMPIDIKEHSSNCSPTRYYILKQIFGSVNIPYTESVFIDFGCGLGRVLMFVSQFPFKKIIGIECSQRLAEICRENLTRHYEKKNKKLPAFQIIQCDAGNYEIPVDANVFYFFHPFDDYVIRRVVDNILKSVNKRKRTLTVIYDNPIYENEFLGAGFHLLHKVDGEYSILALG